MIIVGEKLNSSIPKTLSALKTHDEKYLVEQIKMQTENGADYLDINTAICGETELINLLWIINLIKENSNCGIMLDSPSYVVIKEALKTIDKRPIIVNSVTITERIDELMPIIKETGVGVVGLPIDRAGIPSSFEKRIENAKILIEKLADFGIPMEKIYLDSLTETLSTGSDNVINSIKMIKEVKKLYPSVKTICGISNVSFGLPDRININCAYLTMAIESGLDSAIMDINSPTMRKALYSALAITGQDEYCLNYISKMRDMK